MSKLSKIAKIENEMKRIMRDNEITPKFTWKTFKEFKKKKNHEPTTNQKSTLKNN